MNQIVCAELEQGFVSRQLTGIAFIHDYVQLLFDKSEPYDDGILTLYGKTIVANRRGEFFSASERYRDNLCALIGSTVASIDCSKEQLLITMDTEDTLAVSLEDEDFTNPEAAYFSNHANLMIVIPYRSSKLQASDSDCTKTE